MRYVRNGDVRLAYRVYGDGETDAGVGADACSAASTATTTRRFRGAPPSNRCRGRCASSCYDGRGTGLSDPVTRAPTLDDRVDDLVCVLDAACATQPVVVRGLHRRTDFDCARRARPGSGAVADPLRDSGAIHTGPSGLSVGVHLGADRRQGRRKSRSTGAKGRWRTWCSAQLQTCPASGNNGGEFESSLASPRMAALLWRHMHARRCSRADRSSDMPDAGNGQAGRPDGAVRGRCRTRRSHAGRAVRHRCLPATTDAAFDHRRRTRRHR